MDDIAERVKQIIVEHLFVEPEAVKPGKSLIDDFGMDSLGGFELIIAAEEEFGAEIKDAEAEKWLTVQDVIDCIERLS